MMLQMDLFAAPPRGVKPNGIMLPPGPPPMPLPKRTPAWEKLLASSEAASAVTVLVSTLYTGVCLEVLSDPALGRRWLDSAGEIREFPPDSAPGRTVYATPDDARAWHKRRALRLVGSAGTHACRFIFADTQGLEPLQFPQPFNTELTQ